jgi:site-specific DNA-methyltransferase (adenine-specific)
MRKYQIIYADPPWDGLGWNNGSGKHCPAKHYSVMSHTDIKELPVRSICADTAALFLWVTFPNIEAGLEVIHAWGFKYATVAFTWVKRNRKSDGWFFGLGNYTRANAEICLLGTRGHCQSLRKARDVRQICDAPIDVHSAKPSEIRDRIVRLFGDVPRIELFARECVDGWDSWGNEVSELSLLDYAELKGVLND